MYFESLADLIAMNGHGPFVWAAYSLSLVLMLFLVFSPLIAHRNALHKLQRNQQIEQLRRGGQ